MGLTECRGYDSINSHSGRALALQEGDTTAVILRALEEYITTQKRRGRHRPGKYQ